MSLPGCLKIYSSTHDPREMCCFVLVFVSNLRFISYIDKIRSLSWMVSPMHLSSCIARIVCVHKIRSWPFIHTYIYIYIFRCFCTHFQAIRYLMIDAIRVCHVYSCIVFYVVLNQNLNVSISFRPFSIFSLEKCSPCMTETNS